MSYYIIYKTTNLVNGKIYVGKHKQETSGFDEYLGSGVYLNKAINRYGEENFIRETLEVCVSSCLNEREIYWIEALSSYKPEYPNHGYNFTKGGDGFIGLPRTKKHSDNISSSLLGHSVSKLTRSKISKSKKGQVPWIKGKKHSDETLKKIGKASKGRMLKSYLFISGENKILVNNLKEFCEKMKFRYGTVTQGRYIDKNVPYKGWLIETLKGNV